MLYEFRQYQAAAGRADALWQRFVKEVVPRLGQHGIELLGVFRDPEHPDRLSYISRFENEAARTRGWSAFAADPEWKAVKSISERDGPFLASQTVAVLEPAVANLLLT